MNSTMLNPTFTKVHVFSFISSVCLNLAGNTSKAWYRDTNANMGKKDNK